MLSYLTEKGSERIDRPSADVVRAYQRASISMIEAKSVAASIKIGKIKACSNPMETTRRQVETWRQRGNRTSAVSTQSKDLHL
jgi:hypothetical protein